MKIELKGVPALLATLFVFSIVVSFIYGYFNNIYNFITSDFDLPVKREVITGLGIVIPPVGIVNGFVEYGVNEGVK
jgi:hypothetical protein